MLNVIVADMAASLDFYQRLGVAIPGALTRTRRRSAGPKIGTDPGPYPTPNPAPMPAAPRGSAARGHIGDRHPALRCEGVTLSCAYGIIVFRDRRRL